MALNVGGIVAKKQYCQGGAVLGCVPDCAKGKLSDVERQLGTSSHLYAELGRVSLPAIFERSGRCAHFQLPTSSEICVAGLPSSWGAHAMEYWRGESGDRILHSAEGLSGSAVSMPPRVVASRAGLKSFAKRMRSQNSSWAWGSKRRGVKRTSCCGLRKRLTP